MCDVTMQSLCAVVTECVVSAVLIAIAIAIAIAARETAVDYC